jgi:hypothetical protein
MESRPLDATEIQSEILQRDMQTEMIFCVNCKKQVPKMLFCPNCGYPLYIEGKEKPGEGEIEDSASEIETETQEEAPKPVLEIEEEPLASEEPAREMVEEVESETPEESLASEEPPIEVADEVETESLKEPLVSEESPREVVDEVKTKSPEGPRKQKSFFARARSLMGLGVEKADATVEHEEEAEDIDAVTSPDEPEIPEPEVEGGEDDMDMKDDWVFSADDPSMTHEAEHDEMDSTPAYVEPAFEIEVSPDYEIDPKLVEAQEGLFKSLSMKLWLVDLLRKGEVDEEQYVKKSRDYEAELGRLSGLRRESLARSKDLEPLYRSLREASVSLSELKVKKDLGLISDEEYGVKTPFYEWDIDHLEGLIAGRKAEAAFLEDPRRVISADEFLRMKILAEDCLRSVEMGEVRGVGSDMLSAVRESLRKNRDFLEGFTQI